MNKFIYLVSLLPLLVQLSACTEDFSGNTYDQGSLGETQSVSAGIILDKATIKLTGNSGVGALAGAGSGAIAGSYLGGDPRMKALGAIAGGLGGAVVGHKIDQSLHKQQGYRYIVKLDEPVSVDQVNVKSSYNKTSVSRGSKKSTRILSIVQGKEPDLQVGQRVFILDGGTDRARIIPENNAELKQQIK